MGRACGLFILTNVIINSFMTSSFKGNGNHLPLPGDPFYPASLGLVPSPNAQALDNIRFC